MCRCPARPKDLPPVGCGCAARTHVTDRPFPPLHAVTDDAVIARADFVAKAGEVLEAGGESVALHLRAPNAAGRRLHELAVRLMEVAHATGSVLIVNDRV